MLHRLDHVVYATPDVDETVEFFASRLGIRPSVGGQHRGWGTHNFLASLGDGVYLEIVGPDSRQPDPDGRRPFLIDELEQPRLVTWAMRVPNMAAAVAASRAAGYDPGASTEMSRETPDGSVLRWELTAPPLGDDAGTLPFLLDWQDSVHPSTTAVTGIALTSFRLTHPDHARISSSLAALRSPIFVTDGPTPRVEAVLSGPKGELALRS